jgi:hypothetical protein
MPASPAHSNPNTRTPLVRLHTLNELSSSIFLRQNYIIAQQGPVIHCPCF